MEKPTEIRLIISDPWDFVTRHGSGPFVAVIIEENPPNPNCALIRLTSPLHDRNDIYEYFILQSRHAETDLSELRKGQSVFCNLTAINKDQLKDTPKLNKWRGGLVLIGTASPNNA